MRSPALKYSAHRPALRASHGHATEENPAETCEARHHHFTFSQLAFMTARPSPFSRHLAGPLLALGLLLAGCDQSEPPLARQALAEGRAPTPEEAPR